MNPPVQILEVPLQILAVDPPRHPVSPRRSPGVQSPIGRPETVEIDVVQQRGEPCFLIPHCDLAHAIQRT